jgi:predicted ribosome quality control (RQC) complex YloA/Tae2 family protein
MIEEGRLEFTVLKTREGILKEFTFLNISQYGNLLVKEYFDDAFSMLDYFYQNKDRAAAMRQKADDLFKIIVSSVERISKKLSIQQADIEKCAKKDRYKEKGDLISSYIYSIKKGDREARLANFYKEGSPTETVALDPLLSPSENAQKYYKKYKKAVNAEKYLTEQIKKGKEELEYFDTVLDALTRAETSADIAQLRNELSDQGYIKKRNSAARRQKPPAPLEYFSSDGFRILVGRNNVQNDKLTMKTANKHDIWLHTQKIPGSHVIIFTEGKEVPDRTIVEAASLAAWHSKARNSDKTAVDYCPVKFVKKPPESKPGMVIFSNYKTILVSPSEIRPES